VGFWLILQCQAPPHKRKAPLLKTFWQRFCSDPVNHPKSSK